MDPTENNLPASRRTVLKSTAAGVGVLAGAAAITTATADAASARGSRSTSDFFLLIEGIDGESTDREHRGELEIESFSWGATNSGTSTGGGGGAGKVQLQDFHFVVKHTSASPQLFLACATGEHLRKAVLTVRKAGSRDDFYVIQMEDLLVSSFQTGGSSGADVPMDQVSLNFATVRFL